VVAEGAGCCGSLPHHLGFKERSHQLAKADIAAWMREIEGAGLDAIVVTTSGCGTTIKDYGFKFREDPEWGPRAARVSALAKDITEVAAELGLAFDEKEPGLTVGYHSACSLQHGQQIKTGPKTLLAAAGFRVREPAEAHLCCGSAGTYNMLQPEIASQLQARKAANLEAVQPDVIASGNIGCLTQIGAATGVPVVHTVELLDWATGGPRPARLPG